MRLAIFTSQFPGRVNTFFARDVRTLLEAGIDVDIFPIYPINSDFWKYVPEILDKEIFHHSRVQYISPIQWLSGYKWFFKQTPTLKSDLISILQSAAKYGLDPFLKSLVVLPMGWAWAHQFANRYDHILSYWGNYAATYAYVAHRIINRQIPFSMFLHAGTDLYRNQVFLKEKLLYADNIIVVCDFNKQFIAKLYPDIYHQISGNIYLHHLGLDLNELNYQPMNRVSNTVVGVGFLSKLKGFDFLIKAIYELICKGIMVKVEIVGDGEEANNLRALAQSLGIIQYVHFHGWLTFAGVRDVMSRATVLVHPSSDLGDAVPTVIKEAMALGTPVIASDIVGIPELLDKGHCGILVPPRDSGKLAEAIELMLREPLLRMDYAKKARDFAEKKFDLWENGRFLTRLLLETRRE